MMSPVTERNAATIAALATEVVAGGPPCFCCTAGTNLNHIRTLLQGMTP
jgi:hypothetical protein